MEGHTKLTPYKQLGSSSGIQEDIKTMQKETERRAKVAPPAYDPSLKPFEVPKSTPPEKQTEITPQPAPLEKPKPKSKPQDAPEAPNTRLKGDTDEAMKIRDELDRIAKDEEIKQALRDIKEKDKQDAKTKEEKLTKQIEECSKEEEEAREEIRQIKYDIRDFKIRRDRGDFKKTHDEDQMNDYNKQMHEALVKTEKELETFKKEKSDLFELKELLHEEKVTKRLIDSPDFKEDYRDRAKEEVYQDFELIKSKIKKIKTKLLSN